MCTVSLILIILIVRASAQPQAGNEADFEDWLTWEPSEEIRQLYPMTRVGYDKNGSAGTKIQKSLYSIETFWSKIINDPLTLKYM